MRAAILTLLLPIVATASSLAIRQLPTVPDACTSACDPVNTDLTTCSSMGSTESAAYLQCLCSAAVEADVTACYSCVGQNASGDLLTESQQASAQYDQACSTALSLVSSGTASGSGSTSTVAGATSSTASAGQTTSSTSSSAATGSSTSASTSSGNVGPQVTFSGALAAVAALGFAVRF